MPIEESGNVVMMTCAVLTRLAPADAAACAQARYPVLRQWAVYLLGQEPNYPGAAVAFTPGLERLRRLPDGRALWGGSGADFFPGAVDEVRTFGRVLTAAEVSSSAGLTGGLQARR